MIRSRVFLLPVFILTFLLLSCEFDAPTCTEMLAPILISPGGSVENTWLDPVAYPTFTWLYSGECEPDSYKLIVSKINGDPAFFGSEFKFLEVEINRAVDGPTIIYSDGSTASAHSYTSSEPFEVGTYYWRVIPYSGDFHGERSDWQEFSVFSACEPTSEYSIPPRLVYPRDGQTVITNSPTFLWFDENSCSLPGYYLVQVDESGTFLGTSGYESELINWPQWNGFTLEYCTHYYWKVIPIFGYLIDAGPVSDIFEFTTSAPDGTACVDDEGASPAAASAVPIAEIIQNANCRTGPTTEYPIQDTLPAGTSYEVEGRNKNGTAWLIMDPRIEDACWVNGNLIQIIGDASKIEIADPDPPYFEEPGVNSDDISCSDYNHNPLGCSNNQSCWWDPSVPPNGECKSK